MTIGENKFPIGQSGCKLGGPSRKPLAGDYNVRKILKSVNNDLRYHAHVLIWARRRGAKKYIANGDGVHQDLLSTLRKLEGKPDQLA